jgi:hypothetical protein
MLSIRRPYEMIIRDLGFSCKFLVQVSNNSTGSLCVFAYSEDLGAFVAKQFRVNASFGGCSLDLL